MPGIRYYTVREEREVKVAAVDPIAAVMVAGHVFDSNSTTGVDRAGGRPTSDLRTIAIDVREDI